MGSSTNLDETVSFYRRHAAISDVADELIDKITQTIRWLPTLTCIYLKEAIYQNKITIFISLSDYVQNNKTVKSLFIGNVLDLECEGMPLLSFSILYRRQTITEWMVNNGADVNVQCILRKRTPLHFACEFGIGNIVCILIGKAANVNGKDLKQLTALHYACNSGNSDVVNILLKANASVNAVDKYDMTPLHYACRAGNEMIAHILVGNGANINAPVKSSKMTALHYACKSGNFNITCMLIKSKAAVGALTKFNETSLHYACGSGCEAIVNLLLGKDFGTDIVDVYGNTPLHNACSSESIGTVCRLIKQRANVNVITKCKMTPLHYACESGNDAIVRTLIENDANIGFKTGENKTCLHYACQSGNKIIVEMLIGRGAKINVMDKEKRSVLHYACASRNEAIVQMVINKTIDLHTEDDSGQTPLYDACKSGNTAIVAILLKKRARVNIKDRTNATPLHYACQSGNTSIISLLIEKDAKKDALNGIGKTPLDYVIKPSNDNDLESCIENFKDLNIKHDLIVNNSTLLQKLKNGQYAAAKLLIDHGASFYSIKSKWLNGNSNKRIEPFMFDVKLFHQLNINEQKWTLLNCSYIKILDISLSDHVLSSRLAKIFYLCSLHLLKGSRKKYALKEFGYYKFMFTNARLFLRNTWPPACLQDLELIWILEKLFAVVFKGINSMQLANKLDQCCGLLNGPVGLLFTEDGYMEKKVIWIKYCIDYYPWAFEEIVQTSHELAAMLIKDETSLKA